MGSMIGNKLGLAGEFRVMSELLLRGHNLAKSYLEEGADIILENGLRIEVKSGHRCHYQGKYRKKGNYNFTFKGGARKTPQNLDGCDFVILWCIDDECFFIIPVGEISASCIGICNISPKFKYYSYKDNWDLLEVKE